MEYKKPLYFLSIILSGLLLSQTAYAVKGYEGYSSNSIAESPWYDGIKSTIDHVATTVSSIRSVAWCGIDNAGNGGWKWIQGGWQKNHNGQAEIYWEYTDKNGTWALGTTVAPGDPEIYEQSKVVNEAQWKYGDTIYKRMSWDSFNTVEFKRSYIGAEMHDTPSDHTPGGVENKNKFANSQVRLSGGAYAAANLDNKHNTAISGNVETYAGADSSLRTWDSRD